MKISRVASFCGVLAIYGAAVPVVGLLDSSAVYAQTTSSTVRGSVVSADGTPISDAVIEILHLPSGTAARSTSGATGQFFQGGLRVGGPYRITVSSDAYEEAVVEGLFLDPGSQDPLRIRLRSADDTVELEALRVTGTRLPEAVELNSGVGSTYSDRDIANQPSTSRDVIKTLLRDPLAQSSGTGNLSVAGVNPRFNGLSIDGSLQQDDFGLGSNTYATARSPINLDVIESATLVASDYSVTAQGFTGGLVNIVTKSGGNEFEGSVYGAYRTDSFTGTKFADRRFDPGDFTEKEYGFYVSGPIIKDQLFFLFSYDEYDTSSPADFTNSDITNGRDPAFFNALTQVVQDVYGFDMQGRPQVSTIPETSERLLAKVDWNINYDHRASFTYQRTRETGSSIGATNFESAWYDIPTSVDAYTLQLFSDWTYDFSTTLRLNFKDFERGQNCRAGAGVGHFEFRLGPDDLVGSPLEGLLTDRGTFVGGCDRFRHANEYSDDRLQLFASGDYFVGDHVVTFGAEYEQFNVFNLFVAGSQGRYVFNNYDQIINRSPGNIDYINVPSNNARDGAANWGFDKVSFFIQDAWQITPEFELTAGLRYERYSQSDRPTFSQEILDTYGVRTDKNLDGLDLILPRIGFLWTLGQDTSLSGGLGLFSGGNPQVWVSNSFQVPTAFARATGVTNADIFNLPPELLDAVAGAGTALPIDTIDEDFDIPSDWKGSLRLDHRFDMNFGGVNLGEDYRFTAQYLYTKTNKGFNWANLAQTELSEALPTGVAPDGRPIYADLDALGIANLTQLTNYSSGESHVFTLGLGKRFENGFDFQTSYAHQNVKEVSEGTSSRGISNWRGIFDQDRNNPSPRTSPFQTEHAFKINLGYERNFFSDLTTRVDAFGQIFTGSPWGTSYRISRENHLFGRAGQGENPFDNSPLYVPAPGGDSRVVFAEGFDQEGFFRFAEEEGLPLGQIHAPYSNRAPWNNRWDVRFQQELPGIPGLDRYVGDNSFRLILDIENFLNLLNKDWGNFKTGPSFGQAALVEADLVSVADVNANGIENATALTGDAPRTTCLSEGDCIYRYNTFRDQNTEFLSSSQSVYQIRLTLRYDF